jgi:hypothetical protein
MSIKAAPFTIQPSTYDAEAINVSSADYTPAVTCRGIYVGGAGDVALTTMGGSAITFKAVPAGTFMPVSFTSVQHTGTTATNLLALS